MSTQGYKVGKKFRCRLNTYPPDGMKKYYFKLLASLRTFLIKTVFPLVKSKSTLELGHLQQKKKKVLSLTPDRG